MSLTEHLEQLIGTDAYDTTGDRIGTITQIFQDTESDEPTWVAVTTGRAPGTSSLIPLAAAQVSDRQLTVVPTKQAVTDAPRLDIDDTLSVEHQQELLRYYGLEGGDGLEGSDGPDAVIRHEEHLDIGTQRRATGTARLRKRVVTETQHLQIPVTREELVVEREPISADEARTLDNEDAIGEEAREVTLHEEHVTVTKNQVPVEKVRLRTEEVTDTETVSEQVRKERVDTDVEDRREVTDC